MKDVLSKSAKCKVQSAKCKVQSAKRESGFTLVELSVVIVIIGLIVAGVVGGQALVGQAKLRSVVADFQKYSTAINAFFLSYDQLPGDFSMAQANWGGGVNNGNNDRLISCEGNAQSHEAIDFWEHLNKAEILPIQYIGASAPSTQNVAVGGLNVPKSSYSLHVFSIFSSQFGLNIFNKKLFLAIVLGREGSNCPWCNADLLSKEAKVLDSKIDDGIANTGKLLGVDGNTPAPGSCSARFNTAGADYNLASTTKACRLFYIQR